jgi:transposase
MPSYGNARSGLFRVVARGLVHAEAKHSFVLLPRSRVVERGLAWAARFCHLARDYERLARTLAAFQSLAFACLTLASLFRLLAGG